MKSLKVNLKYSIPFVLFASLFFAACKQENGLPPGNSIAGTKYSDTSGTFVAITSISWTIAALADGNTVFLNIAGNTNADEVTVRAGNSLVDYPISSQNQYLFNVNGLGISIGEYPASMIFQQSTILKAYRGTDTLKVTLTSGNVEF